MEKSIKNNGMRFEFRYRAYECVAFNSHIIFCDSK